MGNLDSIVNVQIDLKSPAVNSASFDNLLILGPAPKTAKEGVTIPLVGSYTDVESVEAVGFKVIGENADPVGIAARIAFSQNPKPTKIYIATQKVNGGVIEAIGETLKRADKQDGWYVLCTAGVKETDFETIAKYIESKQKLFAYTYVSQTNPVKNGEYYRTLAYYGKTEEWQTEDQIPESNKYLHVAAVAKCLSYTAGSETWAFKQLQAVAPSKISSTTADNLQQKHINYFTSVGGKNITLNGQVLAGEWIDVIRFRDYLRSDLQNRVYNLFITNTKIAFEDSGISLIENQLIAGLKRGQSIGGIAKDYFDSDGNPVQGFKVTIPKSYDLTPAEKASRVLSGCSFSATLAGAIHAVKINGDLTY